MDKWEFEPDEEEYRHIKRILDSVWDGMSDWGKWMSQMVVDHLTEEEELDNSE